MHFRKIPSAEVENGGKTEGRTTNRENVGRIQARDDGDLI